MKTIFESFHLPNELILPHNRPSNNLNDKASKHCLLIAPTHDFSSPFIEIKLPGCGLDNRSKVPALTCLFDRI